MLGECIITSIISKTLYKIAIEGGGIVEKKFNRDTQNCRAVNEEVLYKILKANYNSEIGIKLKFKDIKSREDLKK